MVTGDLIVMVHVMQYMHYTHVYAFTPQRFVNGPASQAQQAHHPCACV